MVERTATSPRKALIVTYDKREDVSLYQASLRRMKLQVALATEQQASAVLQTDNQTLVLCFLPPANCTELVSSGVAMHNLLLATTGKLGLSFLCQLRNYVTADVNFLPECYMLPAQQMTFTRAAHLSPQRKWVVRTTTEATLGVTSIIPARGVAPAKLAGIHGLVHRWPQKQLELYGLPFYVRRYVLLTSLHPLRAHLHETGLVQQIYDSRRLYQPMEGRLWTLADAYDQLRQLLGNNAVHVMITRTELAVAQLMSALNRRTVGWMTSGFFHLMSVDVVYDVDINPLVVQVESNPDLRALSQVKNWGRETDRSLLIEDSFHLLLGPSEVTNDVTRALLSRTNEHSAHTDYNEKWLREVLRMSGERQRSRRFSQVLNLHPRGALEKHLQTVNEYLQRESRSMAYEDSNNSERRGTWQPILTHLHANATRTRCTTDASASGDLQNIFSIPPIALNPPFQPDVSEYFATVPHQRVLLTLWAHAQHCGYEGRLDDKYGANRPTNVTVGLGFNRFFIHVVNTQRSTPWIANTYILYITRLDKGQQRIFDPGGPHEMCEKLQDCDMKIYPSLPCEIRPSAIKTWSHLQSQIKALPQCKSLDIPGVWLVPCSTCSVPESCFWRNATWFTTDCKHNRPTRPQLQQCLEKTKLLFIGDSTNRGIMNYVMEELNETLSSWDKTHDAKVYRDINHGKTDFNFVYYPQFWLSAQKRPVFEKAMQQLLDIAAPLENNNRTILVVGGVHWLATHHISLLHNILSRNGLSKILVIIKSLGSGFHQKVDGLHCLSLKDQKALVVHNAGVVGFAKTMRFQVLDTWNMTMVRFKDFLQGKCACHFHRVKERLPSFSQYAKLHSSNDPHSDVSIQHHVEGPVNQECLEDMYGTYEVL